MKPKRPASISTGGFSTLFVCAIHSYPGKTVFASPSVAALAFSPPLKASANLMRIKFDPENF